MKLNSIKNWLFLFKFPLIIAVSIVAHLVLQHGFGYGFLADLITWIGTGIGSIQLVQKTGQSLKEKKLSLDYIAILAILIALFGHYYLVAAVLMLMLSGGYALEEYGLATAKRSLTALIERIPHEAQVWKNGRIQKTCSVSEVQIGQDILVRKGEIIPLDGTLQSDFAETDESSITGEPYLFEKHQGDLIRSGTVNVGNPIVIRVTVSDQHSTYRNIIAMVQQAQLEKSPMIRMADRYSFLFMALTFGIALAAYFISHDMNRVLAVLVVATPCPLILATPIAMMGGVSSASKRHIIIKRLDSLEILSRVQSLIFDKTGTLTLGKPTIQQTTLLTRQFTEPYLLGVSAAIERNSLHPLAKAIVLHAKKSKAPLVTATNIQEKIGHGISGTVDKTEFYLSKIAHSSGMSIGLYTQNNTLLVQFDFEDKLKPNSESILKKLAQRGLHLFLFTGDKKDRTYSLLQPLGLSMTVETDCSPGQKKEKLLALKAQGQVTAMIGDGINDAPALAAADIGMVFSHEEQTASTDAADMVFLGGDLSVVLEAIHLSTQTIRIAKHCILFGIGASSLGMIVAALGYLPPILGAFLQETIDVMVILYALRTSFLTPSLTQTDPEVY